MLGMRVCLSHSFDRFYVVTKLELPKIEDLKCMMFQFDDKCIYIDVAHKNPKHKTNYYSELKAYCEKIVPYVYLYKKQIEYYNWTAYEILTNKINLILPNYKRDKRQKRQMISALVSGFIDLAYEAFQVFCITEEKRHYIKQ